MKYLSFSFMLLFSMVVANVSAAEVRLPPFLPDYYMPVFTESSGRPLVFANERETNGVARFVYSMGANEALSIESINGDAPACRAIFNNVLGHINLLIATNKGAFVEMTETELHAEVVSSNISQTVFVFVLPHAVNIWTHSGSWATSGPLQPGFQDVRAIVDRQRYEEAFREGNVSMGQWEKSIRRHAEEMLKAGRKNEALVILKNLLATAPFDYEAHFEFLENTPDREAATNSAKVIFKNAEDTGQINRAGSFLGIEPPASEKIPLLSTNDTGLEVVLIPLPPCNPWLLDEAARVYERITDVPVKIRRLDHEWAWGSPDRISRQRELEGILVRLAKHNIDFNNWSRDRYLSATIDALKAEDALSKYWGQDMIAKIKSDPGQYRADSRLETLCGLLDPNRSKDARTMYVGITEANIYSGDNNFVFSLSTTGSKSLGGLMSYHMMLGKATAQSFDSRPRLVERIAKELVPASLKQLRIPRSTDPTCPYSYSDGVERLDQKTLTLSDGVKEALAKLKGAAADSRVP